MTVAILLILYLLPSIVAAMRGCNNADAVLVLNVLLGWTFIGWVVALLWAMTGNARQTL